MAGPYSLGGVPRNRTGHLLPAQEPIAEPAAEPVVEPVAAEPVAGLQQIAEEPRAAECHAEQPRNWSETTRLRMELARAKADLVQSENHAEELRAQSRRDLQEMLWQLKDSEQQLWQLHARQVSKEKDLYGSDFSILLLGFEALESLVAFVHPERMQEDVLRADPDKLPHLPEESPGDVAVYVRQSLAWARSVVGKVRQEYFGLTLGLRRGGCRLLARVLQLACARSCHTSLASWRGARASRAAKLEESWQSWQSWERSRSPTGRNRSGVAGGVGDTEQRDLALRCLARSIRRYEARSLRMAIQKLRRHRRSCTRCRLNWSAHLLTRVQRRWETAHFHAWARYCQKLRLLGLQRQLRELRRSQATRGLLSKVLASWRLHTRMTRLGAELEAQLHVRGRSRAHTATGREAKVKLLKKRQLQMIFGHWLYATLSGRHSRAWLRQQEARRSLYMCLVLGRWHTETLQRRCQALAQLLSGARSCREVVLIQAALGSWQQYTLRSLLSARKVELNRLRARRPPGHSVARLVARLSLWRAWGAWQVASIGCQARRTVVARSTWRRPLGPALTALRRNAEAARLRRAGARLLTRALLRPCGRRQSQAWQIWRRPPVNVQRLYRVKVRRCFSAWSALLRRRKRMQALQILKPQATNARWALALWRQHCRVLRVAPLRSESPFLLRTVLRVWRVHLQEKRQRRVTELRSWLHRWAQEVARRSSGRLWKASLAGALARRGQPLRIVTLSWAALVTLGRQQRATVGAMASSRHWLVQGVATARTHCLRDAWQMWLLRRRRRRQVHRLERILKRDAATLERAFRAWLQCGGAPKAYQLGATVRQRLEFHQLRSAWTLLRSHALESKWERAASRSSELTVELQKLIELQKLLRHRLDASMSLHTRRQQSLEYLLSYAFRAWRGRLKRVNLPGSAVEGHYAVLLKSFSFRAWKVRAFVPRAAQSWTTSQEQAMLALILLHWSLSTARLAWLKTWRRLTLRRAYDSQLLLFQKVFNSWRTSLMDVKKHFMLLQRSVALSRCPDFALDHKYLSVCLAFWRLYLRQARAQPKLIIGQALARAKAMKTTWAAWRSWSGLRKADAALEWKAKQGALDALHFCFMSWAHQSARGRRWAQRGQQRRQAARQLVLALRLLLCRWLRFPRRKPKEVQALLCWVMSKSKGAQLRRFWHAWRIRHMQMAPTKRRYKNISTRLLRRSADLAWLRLVLWTWSTRGAGRSCKVLAKPFYAWHLQARCRRQARRRCKALARCLRRDEHRPGVALCFYAMRLDGLKRRTSKLQAMWEEARRALLTAETRHQRSVESLEKELGRLQARSFSDGKLLRPPVRVPEPVAKPLAKPLAKAAEPVLEPTATPVTIPMAKAMAEPVTEPLVPLTDRRPTLDPVLIDFLQRRGGIDDALGQNSGRGGVPNL